MTRGRDDHREVKVETPVMKTQGKMRVGGGMQGEEGVKC